MAASFITEPLKVHSPFCRVLLVRKTNPDTTGEMTMQGDEDQDVRLSLIVSDWAAIDPRQSRVQAAGSCSLSVNFTKQTCSLFSAIPLRMGNSKRSAFAGQNSAWAPLLGVSCVHTFLQLLLSTAACPETELFRTQDWNCSLAN